MVMASIEHKYSSCKTVEENLSSATWHIRSMNPEDEGQFLSFIAAWVEDVPTMDRYQWIYQDNPHGKALTWVAVDSHTNGIIGCSSVFPKKMWFHDHVELGSVGGDTYVDPLWRRNGIAEALHRASSKGIREHGIRLIYGFLLTANLGAFSKAGAFLPGNFVSARLFLSAKPFLKKLKLNGFVSKRSLKVFDRVFQRLATPKALRSNDAMFLISEFSNFDESFEVLNREILPFFKICCFRDCSYLRWRFLKNPFRKYTLMKVERKKDGRLVGFAAIEIIGDDAYISDLYVHPDDDVLEALLVGIINCGIAHSLQSVSLTINPIGPYSRNISACGFSFNNSNLTTLGIMGDAGNDGIESLANWYLTFSDLDM